MFDPHYEKVVLLLPMEGANNSTTFTDVSPSPKTITRNGDTKISTTQSKWSRGSGYFDGNSDYLSVSDSATSLHNGDYTVELWFRLESTPNGGALISSLFSGANDRFPFALAFGNGSLGSVGGSTLYFGYYNGNWYGCYTTLAPTVGQWYHVAVTREGNTLRVFIDGTQSASMTISSQPVEETGAFQIGRRWDLSGTASYVTGYFQDLRITKNVARYTANFTPPAALWRRTTITGTCTVSGNGGAEQVVIRDVASRLLATTATPDEETGEWSATIPVGTYDISYFATDCQPVCHGPYTFTE